MPVQLSVTYSGSSALTIPVTPEVKLQPNAAQDVPEPALRHQFFLTAANGGEIAFDFTSGATDEDKKAQTALATELFSPLLTVKRDDMAGSQAAHTQSAELSERVASQNRELKVALDKAENDAKNQAAADLIAFKNASVGWVKLRDSLMKVVLAAPTSGTLESALTAYKSAVDALSALPKPTKASEVAGWQTKRARLEEKIKQCVTAIEVAMAAELDPLGPIIESGNIVFQTLPPATPEVVATEPVVTEPGTSDTDEPETP